jgi:hypothetical protein
MGSPASGGSAGELGRSTLGRRQGQHGRDGTDGAGRSANRAVGTLQEEDHRRMLRRRCSGRESEFPRPTGFDGALGVIGLDARPGSTTSPQRVLNTYVEHYNQARPHRGPKLMTPEGHEPTEITSSRLRSVRRRDVLGGLIHQYELAAW